MRFFEPTVRVPEPHFALTGLLLLFKFYIFYQTQDTKVEVATCYDDLCCDHPLKSMCSLIEAQNVTGS